MKTKQKTNQTNPSLPHSVSLSLSHSYFVSISCELEHELLSMFAAKAPAAIVAHHIVVVAAAVVSVCQLSKIWQCQRGRQNSNILLLNPSSNSQY